MTTFRGSYDGRRLLTRALKLYASNPTVVRYTFILSKAQGCDIYYRFSGFRNMLLNCIEVLRNAVFVIYVLIVFMLEMC